MDAWYDESELNAKNGWIKNYEQERELNSPLPEEEENNFNFNVVLIVCLVIALVGGIASIYYYFYCRKRPLGYQAPTNALANMGQSDQVTISRPIQRNESTSTPRSALTTDLQSNSSNNSPSTPATTSSQVSVFSIPSQSSGTNSAQASPSAQGTPTGSSRPAGPIALEPAQAANEAAGRRG